MPQKKKIKEVKTKAKKETKQKQKQTQIVNVNIEQKTTKSKSKRKNTKKTNDNPVIGTPTKETLYKFQQANKAPIIMPPIMNNNELLSEMRNILQAHDTRQPIQTTEHNMRAQMANINNLNRLVQQQQPQQPQQPQLTQQPQQPQPQPNPLLQTPPQPQRANPILPTPPQPQRANPILPTPPQPQQRRNLFINDGEIQEAPIDTRSPEQRFKEDIENADYREAVKDNNAKKGIFRRFVNLISPQKNPRLAGRPLDPDKVIKELDKYKDWEKQGKVLTDNQKDYKKKVLNDAKKYKIPIS